MSSCFEHLLLKNNDLQKYALNLKNIVINVIKIPENHSSVKNISEFIKRFSFFLTKLEIILPKEYKCFQFEEFFFKNSFKYL